MKENSGFESVLSSQGLDLELSLLEKVIDLGEESKGSMLGLCLMFLSNIFSSLAGAIIKEMYSYGVTPYEFIYIRGLIMVIFNLIYVLLNTEINLLKISGKVLPTLLLRSLTGCGALLLGLNSLKYLDYSVHTVILNTSPIYVSILGYFFLSETLTKYDIIGIICGFAGICFIVTNNNTNTKETTREFVIWPYLLGIGAALCISLTFFCVRKIKQLSNGEVSVITIGFYFVVISSQVGYISKEYIIVETWDFSWRIGGLLLLGSLFGWLSQLCFAQALQLEKAGRSAAIKYSQVLFAYLFDIFYFHHDIYLKDLIGAILIAGSNFTITMLKVFRVIT